MDNPRTFRDLTVWHKDIALTKQIYAVTQNMPETERFGLTNQMRRAAVSIPSNIAEVNARQHTKDYIRFLVVARASLAELETQVIIAHELQFLSQSRELITAMQEISRMLQGLIASLRRKAAN